MQMWSGGSNRQDRQDGSPRLITYVHMDVLLMLPRFTKLYLTLLSSQKLFHDHRFLLQCHSRYLLRSSTV
jgi:hypothetical protein